MKTGVYILYHAYNPNKLYVGSTSAIGFKQRKKNHLRELLNGVHNNIHLQRVANKYGVDGFIFKVLQEYNPEFCIEAEQYWMDKLNVINDGYNLSKMARCVSMPFEERRISTVKQQKIVIQINKSNKVVNKYIGVHQAGRATGVNSKDISSCCNGRVSMAGGFLWVFEEDYDVKTTKYKSKYNNNGVYQLDKNTGKILKKWNKLNDAAIAFGKGKNGNIVNCCNDKLNSAYGFKWRYIK